MSYPVETDEFGNAIPPTRDTPTKQKVRALKSLTHSLVKQSETGLDLTFKIIDKGDYTADEHVLLERIQIALQDAQENLRRAEETVESLLRNNNSRQV